MKKILIIITVGIALLSFSSCDRLDPDSAATPQFSKVLVKRYMLERAARMEKQPIIIEEVSNVQKITLHGEDYLAAVCSIKGEALAQHYLIYFVEPLKGTDGYYLSGGKSLLEEIDKDGWEKTAADIDKKQDLLKN